MIDGPYIWENLASSSLGCALFLWDIYLAVSCLGRDDRHQPSIGGKTQQDYMEAGRRARFLLPNKGSLNPEEKKSMEHKSGPQT